MTALRQEDDAPRGFVTKAAHYAALAEIDRLKDELAAYREALAEDVETHRVATIKGFLAKGGRGLTRRYASVQMATMLLALLDTKLLPHPRSLKVIDSNSEDPSNVIKVLVHDLNKQMEALGAPSRPVRVERRVGYYLTKDARQWLSERVPEAFRNGGAR